VTFFVEVDDLEAALQDAERLGGRRIADPITFPDKRPSAGGQGVVNFAYFADPEGHVIGLCKGIVRE
jgi:predicted enzyme related to lactoylglutathione lyase